MCVRHWTRPDVSRESAKREAIRLHVGAEELDLEQAVGDPPGLPNQLVGALVPDDPRAVRRHIAPVRALRNLAIEEDPERDGGARGRRTHDEVEIAGVEL